MIFNGVTEYLCRWCLTMREHYFQQNMAQRANTGRSLLFVKRFFFDEMAYKLLYLVDGKFETFGEYLERVRALVPFRKSYVLAHETDPEALELLREAEAECLAFVDGVGESDTAPVECYCRALFGDERERLEYAILEKWGYCADYWYPLKDSFDGDKLFVCVDHLEPYREQLRALVGLPGVRLYEYGESCYEDGQLLEVDDIEGYCGNECAYLPKDLSWIIYFSHEETVTFAGTILPMVRKLLEPEREYWNQWD